MSEIYTVIVVILGILAVSGLFVGVSNDAVNFLNSAIGSKAAPMKTILLVASIGILLGTVTSSGMMEVARNGMFNPGLFSFHEVMMLYMGVMFANVILLDLYNSMGLPTSTTVSLIFCLLGAAVAVSIYKISNDGALGMGDLNHFINTGRAMGIVSAILLSVVIAFTFGTLIMYISRLIFSFRYTAMFRRFGAFWCGASFTAILYFAVFKGLKTPLAGSAAIEWIDQHILLSLFLCWAVGSLLLFFLQRLKINILRLTILSGTFALALAFAGNDLVNFIGVPVAGFDAYSIARHAGDSTILMEGLNASVVFPSGIIGPGDLGKGSITNMLLSFLAGKLPLAVKGGYDFVDVRDVAEGIVSCVEKGVRGKCYILSGHYATIRDILETVAGSTGIKKAVSYIPIALAKIVAPFYELDSIRRKKKLFFTPYAVHVLQSNARFSKKASENDLGYTPRSLKETLLDTVKWLKKARPATI